MSGDVEIQSSGDKNQVIQSYSYTAKLVFFLNARHYVSFEQNAGPVHAHSWQFQVEVNVPADRSSIAFTKIGETIKTVLVPYENTLLNNLHPFRKIQPTTENITMYFFNRLQDALAETGLMLARLTVWETPTRGIEVTSRQVEFDKLEAGAEDIESSAKEAAASSDNLALDMVKVEEGDHVASGERMENLFTAGEAEVCRFHAFHRYAISFLVIALIAFWAYHNILTPPPERRYPWGWDTWGHLLKADFLYHEILKGNYYPQFTEYWYSGCQPFRYWAPLPYYILALLRFLTKDIFTAGNYFVFICALFGGLSWLLYAGRIGLWSSTVVGAIWVVWVDNVRVAFQQGNLPRVLATALLPLLIILFLRVVENRKSCLGIIATAVLIHLIIVCHAMIGAIYCLSLVLFLFFLWAFRGCRLKDCLRGVMVLAGGVATAAWWLLPSLSGGITQIDVQAAKAAIEFVPAAISLNPLHRFMDRESFYWGISLLAVLAGTLYFWRAKPPWAKSLALTGIILVIITFPLVRIFYLTLPLSNLLWPLRFSTFAALALLASGFAFNIQNPRHRLLQSSRLRGFLIMILGIVLLTDCFFSVRLLVFTTAKSFNLTRSTEFLKASPGWRVATIDLSRLGSAPSFLFSEVAGLEQVFGWAWQGAVTSTSIMLLNTGLEYQFYPFLFRSCNYLGATDLIVKSDVVRDPEAFSEAAARAGYSRRATFGDISVWHGLNQPYLIEKKDECLVIGKFAGTIALQFPEVEIGFSHYIDDYPLDYLRKYPKVIFSGAQWRSKRKAEEMVAKYAVSGGRAFVELAGMPNNVLAKQPEFLGVYGEPVLLQKRLEISGKGRHIILKPFSYAVAPWKSYVPQGLDEVELEFDYYGNRAAVCGYKLLKGKRVYFLGGNLAYHAFLTADPVALSLLKEVFGLKTDYSGQPVIPLTSYHATERGYEMSYKADRGFEAIVPIAAMDGIRVKIDGRPKPVYRFENLLRLDLPAGRHFISISLERTSVYKWGAVLSLISILLIGTGLIYLRKTGDIR